VNFTTFIFTFTYIYSHRGIRTRTPVFKTQRSAECKNAWHSVIWLRSISVERKLVTEGTWERVGERHCMYYTTRADRKRLAIVDTYNNDYT